MKGRGGVVKSVEAVQSGEHGPWLGMALRAMVLHKEVEIKKVLDAGLQLVQAQMVDVAALLVLFETHFAMSTVQECTAAFDTFEDTVKTLAQDIAESNLAFLKVCNQLLSRLSPTRDATLRGRVLLLMANTLPLDERSGVNLKQLFNSDSKVRVDKAELEGAPETFDKELYTRLWRMQEVLKDPPAMTSQSTRLQFYEDLHALLACFHSEKVGEIGPANDTAFFPRYLTSYHLMSLQLSDPCFRQQLLLQCHALLSFCRTGSSKVSLELSDEDKATITQLRHQCRRELSQTLPLERQTVLRQLFDRDCMWTAWKDASCKPPLEVEAWDEWSQLDAVDPIDQERDELEARPMGSKELQSLWRMGLEKVEDLADADRSFAPLVETLVQSLEEEEQDEDLEEEMMSRNDALASWRFLRTQQAQDVDAFLSSKGSIARFLEHKMGKLLRKRGREEDAAADDNAAEDQAEDAGSESDGNTEEDDVKRQRTDPLEMESPPAPVSDEDMGVPSPTASPE